MEWKMLTVVCALIVQIQCNNLVEIIEKLNHGIRATTNVFYSLNGGDVFNDILPNTRLPKLIITEESEVEWRRTFDSEILSIVFVEDKLDQALKKTLTKTLHRWHRTDIIFVTDRIILITENWKWLFEWCWKNGFYNVLLKDYIGELVTFDPFPHIQLKKTSAEDYLRNRNNWRDFKGYPIRTSVGNNPPRALVYFDKDNNLIFSGYLAKYLKLFADLYNATLQHVFMPDFLNYSTYDCYKYLFAGRVDICADGGMISEDYVISRPQFMCHYNLQVRFAEPIVKFRYFLLPFDGDVWLLIGLSICYITLVLSVIYWRQSGHWNVGQFLLEAISSFLYIYFSFAAIRGKSKYLILIILIVAGFILSNLYVALLSSILATNVFDRQIDTLEDLREQNISIMISDFDRQAYEVFGASEIITERLIELDIHEFRKYRDVLDPRYAYSCLVDKCELYLYQQKFMRRPRMKLLNEPVSAVWGGMPMTNNWPFEEMMHAHVTRLFEVGFYKRLLADTKEEAVHNGHIKFFPTEYYTVAPLSIEYFQMPAILLGVGVLASLISFMVEHLISIVTAVNL